MTTALSETTAAPEEITYAVTIADLVYVREQYAGLVFDTPTGYEEGRVAIGKLRSTRTAIEARRKELKAGAIEYGRKVDAAAKRLTEAIEDIEEPLRAKRDEADRLKAEEKRQREMAELLARDAELKAAREADEARIKAEQEAESTRLAAERAAFDEAREKANAERAAIEASQAEERARLDAERAELDAKAKAIQDAARAAEEAENRRLAAIQAEKDIAAKAERERVEAAARAAFLVTEAARVEAMKPDIQRLMEWAGDVRAFGETAPDLDSPDVAAAVSWARGRIKLVADTLEKFQPHRKGA